MRDQRKAEEIAAHHMQMLSPLLADGLDPAKAKQLRKMICEQTGLSERTIRWYLAQVIQILEWEGLAKTRTDQAQSAYTHFIHQIYISVYSVFYTQYRTYSFKSI